MPRPLPIPATKQKRSQRTLDRILAAAEGLLNERDFDELTMSELAERAGCAIGTVYARIPSKSVLLECMYERDTARNRADLEGSLAGCIDGDLRARAQALCDLTVDILSTRHGVNRAITSHLFSRAGAGPNMFRREATKMFKQAAAFLAQCRDEIACPDPERACQFALLAVVATAQSRIVDGPRSGLQLRFSKSELKERLARLLLNYLQVE